MLTMEQKRVIEAEAYAKEVAKRVREGLKQERSSIINRIDGVCHQRLEEFKKELQQRKEELIKILIIHTLRSR